MILVFLIIILIFLKKFGIKKGFDNLINYWFIYFLLFLYLMITLQIKYKILLLLIVFLIPQLRQILLFFCNIIIQFLNIEKQKNIKEISFSLFSKKYNFQKEILLLNYPINYLEYFIPLILGEKNILLLHIGGYNIVKFLWDKNNLIPVSKNSFKQVESQIKDKINKGYNICVYFEKDYYNRKKNKKINEKIRTGIFKIAQNSNISVRMINYNHIQHNFGFIDNFDIDIKYSKPYIIKDFEEFIFNVVIPFYNKNV